MATKCAVKFCNNTDLVYSGVDAFMLGGIPTEKICYTCGNSYAQKGAIYEEVKEAIERLTL